MHRLSPHFARKAYAISPQSSSIVNKLPSAVRSPFYQLGCLRQHGSDGSVDTPSNTTTENPTDTVSESPSNHQTPDDAPIASGAGDPGPLKPRDKSNYGSSSKRAMRNVASKQPKDPPRPQLPQWFLRTRVHLREEPGVPRSSELDKVPHPDDRSKLEASPSRSSTPGEAATQRLKVLDGPSDAELSIGAPRTEAVETPNFEINETNWEEALTLISSGFQLSKSSPKASLSLTRPHLLLQCPQTGSASYLDGLINIMAASHEADRIQIDAQDIEEASMDYLFGDEELRGKLRNLSYEAYKASLEPRRSQESQEGEEDEDDSGNEIEPHMARPFNFPKLQNIKIIPKMIASIVVDGQQPPTFSSPFPDASPLSGASEADIKATFLAEAFLDAADVKRASSADKKKTNRNDISLEGKDDDEKESKDGASSAAASKRTLIVIKEYLGIKSSPFGAVALAKLQEVVEKRRNDGYEILIVGTSTGASGLPVLSKSGVQDAQADQDSGPFRTVIMPCVTPAPAEELFADQKKLQILRINIRNLRIMLTSICPDREAIKEMTQSPTTVYFNKSQLYASYLDEKIWPQHQIHRWASVTLGIADSQSITPDHIERALVLILGSDEIKFGWIEEERKRVKEQKLKSSPGPSSTISVEDRMDNIKSDCNSHEKKLLTGIVDPGSIRTTFADVQVEASTIDTLRMLTTLSLIRPDAFSYGVLATERIPGMLLYGPPGTGKTLLAKAVAKESGATVLEVDGSTVYDMYVGEGEKNVRAIFSLAKKLAPCIIFIDEADAILGTRTGSANRTSHRELINQFLREWDGMNETSAFIMVATNRPFDLDEACLRRLPRRVLVDLPTVRDREAILQIHLKDETLAPEVSISKLAAQTPLYSGSDLKNLSVAAALTCVGEEIEHATTSQRSNRRTLHQRHFDRALEEISASISEDMSSLSAIRKFDEKYGDKRGKKRKTGSYGFGTIREGEKKLSDRARVRNQTP